MTKENLRSICFVIPPSPFLADERVFPSLGILRVAASAREKGHPVSVLDLSGLSNPGEIASNYLKQNPHDFTAITATTPQLPSAINITQHIRSNKINTTSILGGPHATMAFTAYEQDRKINILRRGTKVWQQIEEHFSKQVIGDGERAILEIIQNTESKLIRADNLQSPYFFRRDEMEQIPLPARDLIDLDSYHYTIDGQRATSLIGQLGCPFNCGFCGGRDTQAFRLARPRNPLSAVSEVKHLYVTSEKNNNPYKGFMFYDDELNVSPRMLENLCRGLIGLQNESKQQFSFRGFVRADLFTPEQAILMKEAGFKILLTGFESGSTEMLQAMKKGNSPESNARAVEIAHEAGLRVKALMSLGHPGESQETVQESISWVKRNLRPGDDVDWTVITQYPGTPYFDQSTQDPDTGQWTYAIKTKDGETRRLHSESVNYATTPGYYKGIPGEYVAHVWTDYLSSNELVTLRDHAEKVTREHLQLPSIEINPPSPYDHSMGQTLPSHILRKANF